jgi:hypothetical protein
VGLGGVRGVVRDREGEGVAGALVMVADIEKNVTSTDRGEYWRLLAQALTGLHSDKTLLFSI